MPYGRIQVKNYIYPPRIQSTPETPFRENTETSYLSPQIVQGVNVPPSADLKRPVITTLFWEFLGSLWSCWKYAMTSCFRFDFKDKRLWNLRTLWVLPTPYMSLSKKHQEEEYFASFNLLVGKTNPVSSLLDPAFEGKEHASKYHSENVVWFLPQILPTSPWRAVS